MADNLSNLIRLTPLQTSDLPSHPDLPSSSTHPDLSSFVSTLLSDGVAFLSPTTISSTFRSHSTKSSPPSTSPVSILARSIPTSALSTISWSPTRSQPSTLIPEHWFLRRSLHPNTPSKSRPGTASWDEFVFGLRDEHSKHEHDFTPTLYDAYKVLDWNALVQSPNFLGSLGGGYTDITLSIYEMCHAIPPPLSPRSFPVLVATASTSPTSFIAVTVPVDLTGVSKAMYTLHRNRTEGRDQQCRKETVSGVYCAVETGRLDEATGEVEWIMATSSDAKGTLPMWAQKMGIPGAIAKDVGFFLKWIQDVPPSEIKKLGPQTTTAQR